MALDRQRLDSRLHALISDYDGHVDFVADGEGNPSFPLAFEYVEVRLSGTQHSASVEVWVGLLQDEYGEAVTALQPHLPPFADNGFRTNHQAFEATAQVFNAVANACRVLTQTNAPYTTLNAIEEGLEVGVTLRFDPELEFHAIRAVMHAMLDLGIVFAEDVDEADLEPPPSSTSNDMWYEETDYIG